MIKKRIGREILKISFIGLLIALILASLLFIQDFSIKFLLKRIIILIPVSLFISYKYVILNRKYRDAIKELDRSIRIDSTTKLLNHRSFLEEANLLFTLSKREGFILTSIIINLDKMEEINDKYGIKVCDALLVKSAQVIKELTRESDIIARYSDSDFAIILPSCEAFDAYKIAEKIQEQINKIVVIFNGQQIKNQATVGILTVNKFDGTVNELLIKTHNLLQETKKERVGTIKFNDLSKSS